MDPESYVTGSGSLEGGSGACVIGSFSDTGEQSFGMGKVLKAS